MAEKTTKGEMHFGAHGPFILGELGKRVDSADLRGFWKKVDRRAPGLSKGIGVYIAAVQVGSGKSLRPVYVGKTDSSFMGRIDSNHHLFALFHEALQAGMYGPTGRRRLRFFFLARMKSETGGFIYARHKKSPTESAEEKRKKLVELNSIAQLEFLLIGRCVSDDFYLFNSKHKAFHSSLKVAGLYGTTSAGDSSSAEKLAKMFQRSKRTTEKTDVSISR